MHEDPFANAFSRDMMEGGYTFLHRVFRAHFESDRRPTVINTGEMYLSYEWAPGHETFQDGIKVLRGDPNSETFGAFSKVAATFQIDRAFQEGRIQVPNK